MMSFDWQSVANERRTEGKISKTNPNEFSKKPSVVFNACCIVDFDVQAQRTTTSTLYTSKVCGVGIVNYYLLVLYNYIFILKYEYY
jgi:hypothetical protein